jgi:hypothetical protein
MGLDGGPAGDGKIAEKMPYQYFFAGVGALRGGWIHSFWYRLAAGFAGSPARMCLDAHKF